MKLRLAPSCSAVVVLVLALFTTAPAADAAVFTLEFIGTARAVSNPVFGVVGMVPVTASLTYDTSLGSQTVFLPAGSLLDGRPLAAP